MAVHSIFVVGPPRTGTTLLGRLLGNGESVLSLSEPFHLRDLLPVWALRGFYRRFQKDFRLTPVSLPRFCTSRPYWLFLQRIAERNGLRHLVIKEVFREVDMHARWANQGLLDTFAAGGVPIIAMIRHPWDAAASTIRLLDWLFFGWRGRMVRTLWPTVPRFRDHDAIADWAARNWVCFTDWAVGRNLFLQRYEDLVSRPVEHLRRICAYSGLPYSDRMLDHTRWPRAFAGIGAPEVLLSVSRPVHAASVGRGRLLTDRQREIVEAICRGRAGDLGYTFTLPAGSDGNGRISGN